MTSNDDAMYRENYNSIFGSGKPHEGDPEQDVLLMEEHMQEIKRLKGQVGMLQVQIADYQQIVKELSDKITILKK